MIEALQRLILGHSLRVHRHRPVAALQDSQTGNASLANMKRNVILFIAANPIQTPRLDLDEECAAIERELRSTSGRHGFEFLSKWAVTVDDMMYHLNETEPLVVHISSHACAGVCTPDVQRRRRTRCRDVALPASACIQLEDEHRQPKHLSASALAQIIGSAAPSTRLVVLNSCFSDRVAESLSKVIDCVIGMRGAIDDHAARSFAVGFYRALGHRRSVGNALEQGIATLAAKGLSGEHMPVCFMREGIRAGDTILPTK